MKQVLDGTIATRGVLAPMNGEINNPLMKELREKHGFVSSHIVVPTLADPVSRIECREKVVI